MVGGSRGIGQWGWGSAKVSGSASGDYQSGREQFAKQASSAVGEHAAKASSKRQLSVTSESESKSTTGEESVIERTIENVNVRRVLNFVFRGLNQEYSTVLHLTDIQVAFTNRRTNSWRIVPISGLRGLLETLLKAAPKRRGEIASLILKLAGTVIDDQSASVRTLDALHYDVVNDVMTVGPVTMDVQGMPAPPTESDYYRFKPGPLGSQTEVDGVRMSQQTIVMRTDSVLVEALLGESDALDEFAMEVQQAAATAQTLANQRETLLQSTLNAIADPAERAKAAAALYGPVKETAYGRHDHRHLQGGRDIEGHRHGRREHSAGARQGGRAGGGEAAASAAGDPGLQGQGGRARMGQRGGTQGSRPQLDIRVLVLGVGLQAPSSADRPAAGPRPRGLRLRRLDQHGHRHLPFRCAMG